MLFWINLKSIKVKCKIKLVVWFFVILIFDDLGWFFKGFWDGF